MPHAASIYSNGYNQRMTPEVLDGVSRQQGRLPGTVVNLEPSQREIDAKLIMDRLLRECLTRKSP